jgi:signal transduction histidine kinase
LGRTIFINLLSNAIKFSPDADKVIVELSSEKDHTVISVIDYGLGVPESEVEKIFMPFTRGENVDSIQGTGLGLSIVKEALVAMGGEIIVNNTLGNGTTFIVKIPKKQNKIIELVI